MNLRHLMIASLLLFAVVQVNAASDDGLMKSPIDLTLQQCGLRKGDIRDVLDILQVNGLKVGWENVDFKSVLGVTLTRYAAFKPDSATAKEFLDQVCPQMWFQYQVSKNVINLIPAEAKSILSYPLEAKVGAMHIKATGEEIVGEISKKSGIVLAQFSFSQSTAFSDRVPEFKVQEGATVREALNELLCVTNRSHWSANIGKIQGHQIVTIAFVKR